MLLRRVSSGLSIALSLVTLAAAQAPRKWSLAASTLTYKVVHPLHEAQGVSHAAKGEGLCQNGQCSFLVAAPVKSFNSGDSNRDLHMLEVTRGALYPLITVRTTLPESELKPGTIHADLQIQFAGQTVTYNNVPFQAATQDGGIRITGTIPATVSDFKIPPPKLLGMPIHNEIPITVDMTWKPS